VKPADSQIATVVSDLFAENCYIVRLGGEAACLVIDPGLEPEKIVGYLDEKELVPAAILNTHGHIDHTAGNALLKERWPDCPLVIGSKEADKLADPVANLSTMFGQPQTSPPPDATVDEGDVYTAAGIDLKVVAIPGHSSGHVVYYWEDHEPGVVFVGDVIFAGSVGRTDFSDGNYNDLETGIHQKLFTLPDDTVLLSGHGPPTTVGREKQTNPIVGLR